MDIAIVYFGLTRSIKKVYQSHIRHIYQVLDRNQITYKKFMHTWSMKDGIQNNTRLSLATKLSDAEVQIEGQILNYQVSPIAIENGDNASKNRLSLSVQFIINTTLPEEQAITLTSTRFEDFEATTNLSSVENELLENITEQIVQDLINKLMSNW